MKGFSLPSFSIPNISIPKINIGTNFDVNSIKNMITSAVPDISSLTADLNIENEATKMLSQSMGEGVDIPSELKDLIK